MSVTQIGRREDIVDRILSEVADAEDCGKLDLPPLFDAVEPDALEMLVDHETSFKLTFSYMGYDIVLENSGEIDVRMAGETHLPGHSA